MLLSLAVVCLKRIVFFGGGVWGELQGEGVEVWLVGVGVRVGLECRHRSLYP